MVERKKREEENGKRMRRRMERLEAVLKGFPEGICFYVSWVFYFV